MDMLSLKVGCCSSLITSVSPAPRRTVFIAGLKSPFNNSLILSILSVWIILACISLYIKIYGFVFRYFKKSFRLVNRLVRAAVFLKILETPSSVLLLLVQMVLLFDLNDFTLFCKSTTLIFVQLPVKVNTKIHLNWNVALFFLFTSVESLHPSLRMYVCLLSLSYVYWMRF